MSRILVATIALTACIPDPPARPSFQVDVLPILAANCVRCHGSPALGGAPSEFRLDAFDDAVIRDGTMNDSCGDDAADPTIAFVLCGARTRAALTALRIRDTAYPMPPRFPLDDYQTEVLERWANDPIRGEPRAGNREPTIEVLDVVDAGARATISVAVDDVDHDVVSGILYARLDTPGAARVIVGPVGGGHTRLDWDTTGLVRGTYRLVASLDDGAEAIEVSMGTITLAEVP
ncbi:MAG: hypothetical protein ACKV2T_22585 [Kofleriaceae bacterium]